MMNLKQFQDLLDCYGADISNWPHALKYKAESLLASSQEAKDMLVHAQEFEQLLASPSIPEASTDIEHAVMQRISREQTVTEASPNSKTHVLNSVIAFFKMPTLAVPTFAAILALLVAVPYIGSHINPSIQNHWETQLVEVVAVEQSAHVETYALELLEEQQVNTLIEEWIELEEFDEAYELL